MTKPLLEEHEWRFSSVREEHIFFCHYWEFSRTGALESNPDYIPGSSDPSTIFKGLPSQFLWPWPDGAFLSLDDLSKSVMSNLLQGGIYHRALSPLDLNDPKYDLRAYAEQDRMVAFRIDWTRTNTHLRNCFEHWLKENRPNTQPLEARGRGAQLGQMKEDLEALGVYRIIKYHGNTPVSQLIDSYGNRLAARFADEGAWSRAKRRPNKGVERFRSVS
jgi:hypothetical protein